MEIVGVRRKWVSLDRERYVSVDEAIGYARNGADFATGRVPGGLSWRRRSSWDDSHIFYLRQIGRP
jgi:hypothetical protein